MSNLARLKMNVQHFFLNYKRDIPVFLIFFLSFIILFLVHGFAATWRFHVFIYLIYLGIFGAGLWFIRATLLFFVPESVALSTLIIIVFGTNLFYLAGVEHLLQPILAFTLFSGVIYFTASAYRSPRISKIIILGVISGLAILVQPMGYVVLFIPLLWGIHDKKSLLGKYSEIRNNDRNILIFVNVLLLIILFAVVFLKINPGEISFLGFRLPGVFYLNFRFLWNNLFSFDHGWLIYSPAMLLAAVGFYFLAESKREIFLSIFIVCVVEILSESCWTELGKTEVFGQIAFVQLIALLSLPIAFFLKIIAEKKGIIRFLIALICLFFILLNLFQSWQYISGIIRKADMTPELYCTVFGRTCFTGKEIQQVGTEPDPEWMLENESQYTRRTVAFYDFEDTAATYKNQIETAYFKSGKHGFQLKSTGPFSPALKMPYAELSAKRNAILRITVSVFSPEGAAFNDGYLVFSSIHNEVTFRFRKLLLRDLHLSPGEWHTVTYTDSFPSEYDPADLVAGYVLYTGNTSLFIDDLKYELFEPKE